MMDFNLKQWRDQQQESEEDEQQHPAAKIPRHQQQQLLFLETPHHQHQEAALPLFVSSDSESQPLSNTTNKIPPYSYSSGIPTFPREAGRCSFSIRQWQELELQALIFKHMIAGAAVPQELLQLVKKSLLSSTGSPFYNLHHQYQYEYPPHIQPAAALVQAAAGYCWGKGGMDPEPGRCRRTDGKKWRCSRDVVAGHKYCERHVHRGRNRSRKPVEFPPPSLSAASTTPSHFHLNPRSSEKESSDKVLMHFFDDWPRSSNGEGNANDNSSSIRLSMSNTTAGNSTSDFLRLSTGNGNEAGNENVSNEERQGGETMRWSTSMGMGGPLGEALGSSTDHSSSPSPTSVLHQLPPTSVPDNNYVAA